MKTIAGRPVRAALLAGMVVGASALQPALSQEVPTSYAADDRAFFDQLVAQPYDGPVSSGAEPVDFAVLFSDLPDGVSLKTGEISVEVATGATRVEDFAIVYDLEGSDVGLLAEEVLFYNLDPTAILDRANGTNLDQSVKVADRIELRDVKSVGMEAVSEYMMQGYDDTLDEFAPLEGEILEDLSSSETLSYDLQVGQVLLDGLMLEPFEVQLGEDDAVIDDEQLGLQMVGAALRSLSFDALMYRDVVADMDFSDGEIEAAFEFTIGMNGVRDYDRGDLAFSGSWDTEIGGTFPIPASEFGNTDAEEEYRLVPINGAVAYSAVSDMKLQRAFEALSSWTLPDASDTDFMRLGTFEMARYDLDIDGLRFFGMDRMLLDADFHWLLPKAINLSFDGLGYELGNLFTVFAEDFEQDFEQDFTLEQFMQGLEIAKTYGFDCFCGDYSLSIDWDEETGALSYDEAGTFAEAFASTTLVDLTLPSPAAVASLLTEGELDEDRFIEAFAQSSEFRSAEMTITDTGGLARIFPMLHEIGEAFPEAEGMAILAYNEPEQLRMLAYNMVISVKPMVRNELPAADPWMTSVAEFIRDGGSLKLSVSPPAPINAQLIESYSDTAQGPDEILEILGVSVTHTN
ncbi:MAG: hypothetical protein AAF768_06710 [Pseudomonadota bacterium]